MGAKPTGASSNEAELMETLLGFKYDPMGYVTYAYPWETPNTPLEKYSGPRTWQADEFKRIADHLQLDVERARIGLPPSPYYLAVSSGRGPGKSAFLAMLGGWLASCWLGATGIFTANTETQLRSRTMAELGKWNAVAVNSHWFEKSSMALRPAKWFAELLERQLKMDTQYYYVEGQSWSAESPDAFAGAHSTVGMMLAMDEASGIDDAIWDVAEGFFTDLSPLRLWIAISNPRRNTGKFFDCFHDNSEYWNTRYIDSRTVEGVDTAVYDRIAKMEGEDSDVTRVEVKGEFPRQGDKQFISRELVEEAAVRQVEPDPGEPLIMGIDVARFGADKSVFAFRQGRDARSIPMQAFQGLNTMQLAQKTAWVIDRVKPDAVMIDGGGVGGGVIDRLKEMRYKVIEVLGSEKCFKPERFMNKRVETWFMLKEWLAEGAIPDTWELKKDLTGPEFDKHKTTGKWILEAKADMKKRGQNSPDYGDALALTFARRVSRVDRMALRGSIGRGVPIAKDVDYPIFG